jgi:hypothetical protein
MTSLESYNDPRKGEGNRLVTRVQCSYSYGPANEIVVNIPDSLSVLVTNSPFSRSPGLLNQWIIEIDNDPHSQVSRDLLKVAASIEEAMMLFDDNQDKIGLYSKIIGNLNTPFVEFFDGEIGWSNKESPARVMQILKNLDPSCRGLLRDEIVLNLDNETIKAHPTILSSIGLYVAEKVLDTGEYINHLILIRDKQKDVYR